MDAQITKEELSGYTLVKDNHVPIYLAIVLVLMVYIGFHYMENDRAPDLYIWYFPLALFLPLFQLFRTRTCPVCHTTMKRYFNSLLPRVCYCEKCKTKIPLMVITF